MKHYFGWLILAIIAVVGLGVYYFLKYQKTSGLILYSDVNDHSKFYYPKNYLLSESATPVTFESNKDDSRFSFQYFSSQDLPQYLNNEEQKILNNGQTIQYGQNNYFVDQANNNFIFSKEDLFYIFRFTPEFVQKETILSTFKP